MSKYGNKLATPEQVASLVRDGMWVDYGTVQAPRAFDRALAQRVGEVKNVKIRALGHLTPLEVMEKDPEAKSFWIGNWHILGWTRKYIAENRGTHIPYNFGEAARYYRDGLDVDIAVQIVTDWCRQAPGRALWIVGETLHKVQTVLHPAERPIAYTNQILLAGVRP